MSKAPDPSPRAQATALLAETFGCEVRRNGGCCPECATHILLMAAAITQERERCIEIAQGVLRKQGSGKSWTPQLSDGYGGLERAEVWNAAVRAVVKKLRGKESK